MTRKRGRLTTKTTIQLPQKNVNELNLTIMASVYGDSMSLWSSATSMWLQEIPMGLDWCHKQALSSYHLSVTLQYYVKQ